jgi:hypothetical protein
LSTRIDRPCRVDDGVVRLEEADQAAYVARAGAAASVGRVTKLVPASGAASRMFQTLLAAHHRDLTRLDPADPVDADVLRLEAEGRALPFAAALAERGIEFGGPWSGETRVRALDLLLNDDALGYAAMPKGLLPFHLYPDGARTPLAEHVIEAVRYARTAAGRCGLHVTISEEHRDRFDAWLEAEFPKAETDLDTRIDIAFSSQSPSTDTIALDEDGGPFRRDDGSILFRPGGHGSLVHNLNALDGDIVVVKNIDNVVRERDLPTLVHWKQVLIGCAVEIQAQVHRRLRVLESSPGADDLAELASFLETTLGERGAVDELSRGADAFVQFARERLDRPLRVCGVVPNDGEPGGGPFWVRSADGRISRQVVESSQIDVSDAEQRAHLEAATHFNPVDLVCALTDVDGLRYDLTRFVDPDTAFISEKSEGKRSLRALELPGLWNGAMAGWTTLFVEVPSVTFAPVKTVFDLLRPAHQPSGG